MDGGDGQLARTVLGQFSVASSQQSVAAFSTQHSAVSIQPNILCHQKLKIVVLSGGGAGVCAAGVEGPLLRAEIVADAICPSIDDLNLFS